MKGLFGILLLIFVNLSVFAQDKSDLYMQQIAITDSLINYFEQINYSEEAVFLLQSKTDLHEQMQKGLSFQLEQLNKEISNHMEYIKSLKFAYETEKAQYAKVVVAMYRYYMFSKKFFGYFINDSFYTFYNRYNYLQRLSEFRKHRINRILVLTRKIDSSLVILENTENNRLTVLAKISNNMFQLKSVMERSKNRKKILEQNRALLRKSSNVAILDEQQESDHLQKAIVNKLDFNNDIETLNDSIATINDWFRKRKGKLNWPVKKGVILRKFGDYPHPVLPDIKVRNNGIDISCAAGQKVYAIADGIVSHIVVIPGQKSTVLIRHGNFYTVYSGLIGINIAKDDLLKAGDVLGLLPTERKYHTLGFQIWHDKERLNPEVWISKFPK